MVGQIVHIKEDAHRSKERMGKIIELIERRDNEIRAATVLLPNGNTIKRLINLLYHLKTALVDTIEQNLEDNCQKENGPNNIFVEQKLKRKTPSLTKDGMKTLLNEEFGTFVCCQECQEDREI